VNKVTEQSGKYRDLEKKEVLTILSEINAEDKLVAEAVSKAIPQIENLVKAIFLRMKEGGRLFYIGAGTSGRLGILDASECPPTFGVSHDLVIGIIAGGDVAIRKAVEFAEDDENQAYNDLQKFKLTEKDSVIGIAASGTTPYVIGGLKACNKNRILTGCITCNNESELSKNANYPIEVIVGPEYVRGSTRMKSGTAQKLVLNMISTSLMIKLGKVKDNRMVDMQLSNDKLVERGVRMIMESTQLTYDEALHELKLHGNVRDAIDHLKSR
jgi:N-acetylmuramic acid 6-phosphate etherase